MPRILLAEDDDSLRGFLSRALERAGYEVTSCADGEEAAAVLDQDWDLLLTDIVMPGMDGIEVARLAAARHPGLRIMFITGFAAVALAAAFLLFVLPASRRGPALMDWATAARMPWGILLLFGGGLSLAEGMEAHKVSTFIASQALVLRALPSWLFLAAILAAVVALSAAVTDGMPSSATSAGW